MQSIKPFSKRAMALVLLFPLLTIKVVHADQADAFNFFVGKSYTRDNNVFRLSDNTDAKALIGSDERGDTIRSTYVGGTFDKLIGRQQIKFDLNLADTRYDRFQFLDYVGGSAKGAFNWKLTDVVTGSIGRSQTRSLAGFGDFRSPVQSILISDTTYSNLDVWLDPDWHTEVGVRRIETQYGSALNRSGDSTNDAKILGLRYTPSSGNYILLRTISSEGEYPNRVLVPGGLVDNSFKQNDSGLEASWLLTGKSRLDAALYKTERKHRSLSERDFSGKTGKLTWEWGLSGATSIVSKVRRELGGISDDPLASYVITDIASMVLNWAPTAKLGLALQFERRKKNFAGDPITFLSGIEKRHDRQKSLNLSVSYQPMTYLQFAFNVGRDERLSSSQGLSYNVTTSSLNAQFSF